MPSSNRPLCVIGVIACAMLTVARDQSHWWRNDLEYSYGWFAPCFVTWIVYDRWDQIRAMWRQSRSSPASHRSRYLGFLGWVATGIGAAVMIWSNFRQLEDGPRPEISAVLAGGMVIFSFGVLLVGSAGGRQAGINLIENTAAEPAIRLLAHCFFPIAIWMLSFPLPRSLDLAVSTALQSLATNISTAVLSLIGVPHIVIGFQFTFDRGGSVYVARECSGIISLTAVFFVGSFLAANFIDRLRGKVLFLAVGAIVALVINQLRVFYLMAVAISIDPEPLPPTDHDMAGYVALGVTCLFLLILTFLANLRVRRTAAA